MKLRVTEELRGGRRVRTEVLRALVLRSGVSTVARFEIVTVATEPVRRPAYATDELGISTPSLTRRVR